MHDGWLERVGIPERRKLCSLSDQGFLACFFIKDGGGSQGIDNSYSEGADDKNYQATEARARKTGSHSVIKYLQTNPLAHEPNTISTLGHRVESGGGTGD